MRGDDDLPLAAEPVPLERWPDGSVRLRGSRTPFYLFVESLDRGATPDQLFAQYDSLSLADVYTLIGYRHRHATAVLYYLAEVNRQAAEVRRKFEALNGPQPTREELLARLAARRAVG
jgi:uncharacterized protein (DUF433 family)